MKLRYFLLVVLIGITTITFAGEKGDWGKNGHRTTAKIAEGYLKKKTLKKIITSYYNHVTNINRNSLLCKIYGFYSVNLE